MKERKEKVPHTDYPQPSPHLYILAVLNAVMWRYVLNSFRQDPTTLDYLCSSHYTHKSAGRV